MEEFKKVVAAIVVFLHRSPVVKTVIATAAGGAVGMVFPLIQAGTVDPATLIAAAKTGALTALTALVMLWVKRPSDATPTDKGVK